MRIIAIILGFILGSFMIFNGTYEIITHNYFGSSIPRPWMDIVNSLGINAFAFGPVFIVLGGAWLYFIYLLATKQGKAFFVGLLVCVLTLWYIPFGAIISVITIGLLRANKKPSGLLR